MDPIKLEARSGVYTIALPTEPRAPASRPCSPPRPGLAPPMTQHPLRRQDPHTLLPRSDAGLRRPLTVTPGMQLDRYAGGEVRAQTLEWRSGARAGLRPVFGHLATGDNEAARWQRLPMGIEPKRLLACNSCETKSARSARTPRGLGRHDVDGDTGAIPPIQHSPRRRTTTSPLQLRRSSPPNHRRKPLLINDLEWWRRGDSNPRPLECDSSALPIELRPHGAPSFYAPGRRLSSANAPSYDSGE